MTRLVVCAALVAILSAVSGAVAQQVEGAYLARGYSVIRFDPDSGVSTGEAGAPVLIVTLDHFIPYAQVAAGVRVIDLETGTAPPGLEVIDWGSEAADPPGGHALIASQYVLSGGLRPDGRYEVRILYTALDAWEDRTPEADSSDWHMLEGLEDAVYEAQALPEGQTVTPRGTLIAARDQKYVGLEDPSGVQALFRGGRFSLVPELAEDTNQLGASYDVALQVDAYDVGWFGRTPGRFEVDLEAGGRFTTDAADLALAGHAEGDVSVRVMALPGRARYYPLGLRAALGYESGEEFRHVYTTATAQLVVSVPYVERLALAWHRLLGVERAFAPPFVSGAVVYAEAADAPVGSRWELEAGWIVPVAERWDLSLRWRHFAFHADGRQDDALFEGSLVYYVDDDRSQGLRFSLEEGFRPAVGDIGSTLLFGYLIKPM